MFTSIANTASPPHPERIQAVEIIEGKLVVIAKEDGITTITQVGDARGKALIGIGSARGHMEATIAFYVLLICL